MRGDTGPVARSHYRQMKIIATQMSDGAIAYSIYGKRLNDGWQERHCLVRDILWRPPAMILTTEDVAEVLAHVLAEQRLPGID